MYLLFRKGKWITNNRERRMMCYLEDCHKLCHQLAIRYERPVVARIRHVSKITERPNDEDPFESAC